MKNFIPISLSTIGENGFITFIAFIFSCGIFAQDLNKRLTKGDQSFDALEYINAQAVYLDVAQRGYSSPDLFRKLADSYYFTGEPENSVQWYEKFIQSRKESDVEPEYLFRYAQSLKSIERYREADSIMESFNIIRGNDRRAKSYVNKRDYLNFIEMQSGKYDLYRLNINSKYSDYAPSFNYNNQIVFATSRSRNEKEAKLHEWNGMPFLDLFSSDIKTDTINLKKPTRLKGRINTKYHESSSSFSKDGKTVYFTRNNFNNNKLGKSRRGIVLLKLYKASLVNDKWSDIKELPFNSDNYSISHPALSPDGKKLYFASDMPGTRGKSDLFVVDVLGGGRYGKPKNLGDNINTEGRETFPYISDSGRLYFASDGHVGLGGLDVFVALPDVSGFSDAFNVGKPVNSPKDDFTFVLDETTKIGYFASNRKGGKGNDDIYSFKQKEELITSCRQYIVGTITDINTGEFLAGTEVTLMNGTNGNLINQVISDENGVYKFDIECDTEYLIKASKNEYVPSEINLSTEKAFEYTNVIPIALDKAEILSTSIAVKEGDDLSKILQLESIYFDLDDSEIRSDSEVELQKIISVMNQYPDLRIEVGSHTDSRSSYWYNKKLSVKRMRATIRYLVRKGGIHWRRLKGKAYGERVLFNNCADGVPCTEEEHQLNRRSEFIIIK
ncbi:OmpA family protein [Aquimarina sp. 2201CG5-10]|uniref:OmpA family protein n=1 Tax=Aquimarina callyspongiae TaxID=3098150 RepID=UPI002AB51458|nr:OmpA family protein [Aquimarina sp. 2201CG5-10]MDY8134612.1 OmpA family protein [Aquimarina sp. 2201CG5-10]